MNVEILITPVNAASIGFNLPSNKENNLKGLGKDKNYPKWAELQSYKCRNCSLSSQESYYCPAAVKIVDIANIFPKLTSYELVTFELKNDNYTFKEKITAQDALVQIIFNSFGTCACPEVQPETWSWEYFHPRNNLKGILFRGLVLKLLAYHIGEIKGKSLSKYLDKHTSLTLVLTGITKRIEEALTETEENYHNALVILNGLLRMVDDGYEEFILDEIENNIIGHQ